MGKKHLLGGLIFVMAMFGFASSLMAQNTASISGTVTDKTGAVIAKAAISVLDETNGTKRTTVSNGSGEYSIPFLRASTYRVTSQATGFEPLARTGVVLNVDQSLRLDFMLTIGSATDSVTVTGAGEMLQTDSASVSTVVDRQFIENMPLNGRSFQSLISLTPGVVITGASVGSGQFEANGQRSDANYFTLDGVSANVGGGNGLGSQGAAGAGSGVQTSTSGGYNSLVSVDALQEFRIETSTFAPEFGRLPGAQVILVTRSGTNAYHGDVFEYLRNTVFDANSWFGNFTGQPRPPERQNDFGGVFGGPILKDKLFFFFSYEGQRLVTPQNAVTEGVPTLCARGNGGCTGTNVAAAAALQPFLKAYPLPSSTPACALTGATDPNVAPFCSSFSDNLSMNAYSLRLDWNATSKMLLFTRVNDAPSNGLVPGTPLSQYTLTSFKLRTITVGQTYVIKPNLTSDLRYNYTYSPSTGSIHVNNFGGAVPVPTSFFNSIPNYTGMGLIFSGTDLTGTVGYEPVGLGWTNQQNIIENLAWVHGKHQMKYGVDFRRIESSITQLSPFLQIYSFTLSGNSSSWINNQANAYTIENFPVKDYWYYNYSFYGEDTWKVTPRLTLTYGLRWDINPAPGGAPGNGQLQALTQINFSNLSATQVAPAGTPVYPTQWAAFAPRLGFAYQLSTDPRFGRVVRGGYGIFYDTGGIAAMAATGQFALSTVSGNATTNVVSFPVSAALAVAPQPSPGPPIKAWGNVSTVSPNFRLPYTHEWNVALEQQLGRMQTLSVTYAGSLGESLPRRDQYFPFNTNFSQATFAIGSEGYSSYNSMQVQFQRRLSHGLQLLASYTWAHSLDSGSAQITPTTGPGGLGISTNIEPISDFYGNSDFDIRHSFQTAISYNVPSPSQNPVIKYILGNWGIDTIFRARSALPVDLTDSNVLYAGANPFLPVGSQTANPNGGKYAIRPFVNPGVPYWLYGAACSQTLEGGTKPCPGGKGLNPAAFNVAANNVPSVPGKANLSTTSLTQGNLGRNQLRAFGWNQVDMSLRRDFPIVERVKLQFRADCFNLFNHPSFYFNTTNFNGSPLNVDNTTGTFGVANSMLNNGLSGPAIIPQGQSSLFQIGGPRSMQFSLKVLF